MALTCTNCNNPRYSNSSYCFEHHKEYMREYREKNREKILAQKREYMARRRASEHGGVGGVCQICKRNTEVFQDFDPQANPRGLLCANCLEGVVAFKNDPTLFVNALEYFLEQTF